MHPVVNTEQAQAWNGYEGQHWADFHDRYDAVNSGFNELLLTAAAIDRSERVLDIGCGCGQLTRLAARQATLGGHVVGIDLSAPMLARAAAIAFDEDVANVTLVQGDAQVYPLQTAGFDVAVSRFGVMFFADPVTAFANVGRALRPGGRLAFLSMRDLGDLGAVFAAMEQHLPAREASQPESAGPLSLADPAIIRSVVGDAGFADIEVSSVEATQVWGRDAVDAAAFLGAWGPVRFALDQVDHTSATRAHQALAETLQQHEHTDAVRLRGTAWLVRAVRQ